MHFIGSLQSNVIVSGNKLVERVGQLIKIACCKVGANPSITPLYMEYTIRETNMPY